MARFVYSSLLTLSLLALLSTSVFAQHEIARIKVDPFPTSPAVNTRTNKIYVANQNAAGTVDVIDGASNTQLTSIPVGNNPSSVAVNSTTNLIYLTNLSDNTVSVIDGNTDTVVATIPVDVSPLFVSVNPRTNRIYVANFGTNSVSVIDGTTNQVVATVAGNSATPFLAVATNPTMNLVYVADLPGSFSVIDGQSNVLLTTIALPPALNTPEVSGVAADPGLNRVYIVDQGNSILYAVDSTTNTILTTVSVANAVDVAVNLATHTILVGTGHGRRIVAVNPTSFQQIGSVGSGVDAGIAINPITKMTYVALFFNAQVEVIGN